MYYVTVEEGGRFQISMASEKNSIQLNQPFCRWKEPYLFLGNYQVKWFQQNHNGKHQERCVLTGSNEKWDTVLYTIYRRIWCQFHRNPEYLHCRRYAGIKISGWWRNLTFSYVMRVLENCSMNTAYFLIFRRKGWPRISPQTHSSVMSVMVLGEFFLTLQPFSNQPWRMKCWG